MWTHQSLPIQLHTIPHSQQLRRRQSRTKGTFACAGSVRQAELRNLRCCFAMQLSPREGHIVKIDV